MLQDFPAKDYQHSTEDGSPSPACSALQQKMQALTGLRNSHEGGTWLECCIKTYFTDKTRPVETCQFRIFDTKLHWSPAVQHEKCCWHCLPAAARRVSRNISGYVICVYASSTGHGLGVPLNNVVHDQSDSKVMDRLYGRLLFALWKLFNNLPHMYIIYNGCNGTVLHMLIRAGLRWCLHASDRCRLTPKDAGYRCLIYNKPFCELIALLRFNVTIHDQVNKCPNNFANWTLAFYHKVVYMCAKVAGENNTLWPANKSDHVRHNWSKFEKIKAIKNEPENLHVIFLSQNGFHSVSLWCEKISASLPVGCKTARLKHSKTM